MTEVATCLSKSICPLRGHLCSCSNRWCAVVINASQRPRLYKQGTSSVRYACMSNNSCYTIWYADQSQPSLTHDFRNKNLNDKKTKTNKRTWTAHQPRRIWIRIWMTFKRGKSKKDCTLRGGKCSAGSWFYRQGNAYRQERVVMQVTWPRKSGNRWRVPHTYRPTFIDWNTHYFMTYFQRLCFTTVSGVL